MLHLSYTHKYALHADEKAQKLKSALVVFSSSLILRSLLMVFIFRVTFFSDFPLFLYSSSFLMFIRLKWKSEACLHSSVKFARYLYLANIARVSHARVSWRYIVLTTHIFLSLCKQVTSYKLWIIQFDRADSARVFSCVKSTATMICFS